MIQLITDAINDPETRLQGLVLAAATRDGRYRALFERLALDAKMPVEARAAAVEAIGSFDITPDRVPEQLVAAARGKPSSDPVAEAAVRAMAQHSGVRGRLADILTARDYPLGLRREALRSLAGVQDGGYRVLELAKAGKLPDDLKGDATTLLYSSPVRGVREAATQVLPLPKLAGGRTLPPIGELIRSKGDAEKGRQVFFRTGETACGSCHRVQGRGQWIGPDLSTIGAKYGRDELIRSILSPSAAIGYNFRSVVVALTDGRVVTGLPVEETADRLVLKTAAGERVAILTGSIEERRTSDVSLMPDGLAQTLTDHELVDLIAYLSTLRQPAAIAGQYHVLGPVPGSGPGARIDPTAAVDLDATVDDGRGRKLSWRRVNANAEGLIDLAALAGADSKSSKCAYLYAPLISPVAQKARLVIDTQTDAAAWVNGNPVMSSTPGSATGIPRSAELDLRRGSGSLLIRVPLEGRSGTAATLVTTIVADQPVGFTAK